VSVPVRFAARLRSAHPFAVDIALAGVVLVAVSLQFILPTEEDRATWLGFALGVGTAVPLVWRRRAPILCSWLVSAFTTAMAVYCRPAPEVTYGGLVVLYTVASLTPAWHRRTMVVAWLGVSTTVLFTQGAEPLEFAFQILIYVSAYALGMVSRVQQAYTAAVEDRARRLEAQRESEVARATARERARIARDMHDILAHAVSLMVVQAEAGPVVVRSDPVRAEAAFDAIADTGRDAMAQLRRILGVLKEERLADLRSPQPTISALPHLVEQVARTGLAVELITAGRARPVPPDTEVAAYRLVQEALTNTLKHAAAGSALVRLDWTDNDTLVITATDDGTGTAAPGPGGGQGLIGIRERAAACGGAAEAGPAPGGGFRVAARLPVAGPGTAVR
jgi:signal transduction histidine kinase